jgi:hypothetical protein
VSLLIPASVFLNAGYTRYVGIIFMIPAILSVVIGTALLYVSLRDPRTGAVTHPLSNASQLFPGPVTVIPPAIASYPPGVYHV